MIDVPNGLGIKNISDLVRKEICGFFETKNQKSKLEIINVLKKK